jgi:hypothetical protein
MHRASADMITAMAPEPGKVSLRMNYVVLPGELKGNALPGCD